MSVDRDTGWGRLAKANQQLAYAMLTAVAAYYFGGQQGLIHSTPVPVAPLVDPDSRTKILMAAEAIQANNRLLQDLHSGIAPRDPNLIPQWAAMRTAMDRQVSLMSELAATLRRNADAAYRLTGALEANAECLRPMTPSVNLRPGQQEATDQGFWRRFLGWMSSGVDS